MGAIADLHDLCVEYLGACSEAVAQTAAGPINRAYVSPGAPAFDCCPFLAVYAGGPAEADTLPLQPALAPARRDTVQGAVHVVSMTATVIRCAPVVEMEGNTPLLPDPAAMQASAKETHDDLWAIWNHLRHKHQAKEIWTTGERKREVFYQPAVPVLTSGGCAGFEIQVLVALDGYAAPA